MYKISRKNIDNPIKKAYNTFSIRMLISVMEEIMNYIYRHMENRVLELSQSYSAILLTGPRQSGKTTMLRTIAEKENKGREYVSLDDLTTRDMAKNDPALFLQIHKPPVLIDEVQYAPELFTYIKIHIDEHHNPGDFWMTGSQIFRLMKGVQESLAGRVALLHMSPMSQREIIGADSVPFTTNMETLLVESKKISPVDTPKLFERIWRGSMPGIVSGLYPDRNMYYSSYISTYVERDVRELSGTVDALKFNRFITAVAARTSQLLNYKAIADDADIDMLTAKAWVIMCGPPIMIKFTLAGLQELGFKKEQVFTTLEMKMKCGFGKCGRCNIANKYICKDGPVFSFDELDELPDEY